MASPSIARGRNDDPLYDLFDKIQSHVDQKKDGILSYVILFQHSQAFPLRQQSATFGSHLHNEETVLYRSAGLRTPAESAARDLEAPTLWLQHITTQLLEASSSSYTTTSSSSLLWVNASTQKCSFEWSKKSSKIRVIDAAHFCARYQFGSQTRNDSGEESSLLMDLVALVEAEVKSLSSARRVPLVLDSLTPFLLAYGAQVTVRLLQRLSRIPKLCPVIAPVKVELLTPGQHRILEDAASAILVLSGGDALLLRRGVRERDSLVRENMPYQIITDNQHSQRRKIILIAPDSLDGVEVAEKGAIQQRDKSASHTSEQNNQGTPGRATNSRERRKVELRLEETPRKVETSALASGATTARIYVQDDDPEYQDYDEEDPDDDLDI